MVNKTKYKRQYHAKKSKKNIDDLIILEKADFNSHLEEYMNSNTESDVLNRIEKGIYFTAEEMRSKLFQKTKEDEKYIGNKLDKISNLDLADKLDGISTNLNKYIKHSKKWLILRIGGGISIGVISLGLFVYGKIKLDTLIELLKVIGSSIGLV